MSRGVSTKLTATLPETYSPQWLARLDKRTKVWRAIAERIAELESDAGGREGLSHAKKSLIQRTVFLELLCETSEMRFAAGETADVGSFTQCLNSLLGSYRLLGIERRQKPLASLRAVMAGEIETP